MLNLLLFPIVFLQICNSQPLDSLTSEPYYPNGPHFSIQPEDSKTSSQNAVKVEESSLKDAGIETESLRRSLPEPPKKGSYEITNVPARRAFPFFGRMQGMKRTLMDHLHNLHARQDYPDNEPEPQLDIRGAPDWGQVGTPNLGKPTGLTYPNQSNQRNLPEPKNQEAELDQKGPAPDPEDQTNPPEDEGVTEVLSQIMTYIVTEIIRHPGTTLKPVDKKETTATTTPKSVTKTTTPTTPRPMAQKETKTATTPKPVAQKETTTPKSVAQKETTTPKPATQKETTTTTKAASSTTEKTAKAPVVSLKRSKGAKKVKKEDSEKKKLAETKPSEKEVENKTAANQGTEKIVQETTVKAMTTEKPQESSITPEDSGKETKPEVLVQIQVPQRGKKKTQNGTFDCKGTAPGLENSGVSVKVVQINM